MQKRLRYFKLGSHYEIVCKSFATVGLILLQLDLVRASLQVHLAQNSV